MDYEPETAEESEFIDFLCDDVRVCSAENVGRCNTCYSIARLVKERAVLMPLAADGKPIMPGDTMWNIFSGERCYVLFVKCFEDATLVAVRYKDYVPFFVTADSLTHVCQTKAGGGNGAE